MRIDQCDKYVGRPRIGRTRHGVAANFRYALTLQAKPPRRCLTQGVPAVIVYQATKRQFIHDPFNDDIGFVLSQQYLRPSPVASAVLALMRC